MPAWSREKVTPVGEEGSRSWGLGSQQPQEEGWRGVQWGGDDFLGLDSWGWPRVRLGKDHQLTTYTNWIQNWAKEKIKIKKKIFFNGQQAWIDIFPKETDKWPARKWKDAGHHQASQKCKPRPQTGLPCGSAGKESTRNVGDLGSVPGLGRSPGEGKGYPLQYSGLENSMNV